MTKEEIIDTAYKVVHTDYLYRFNQPKDSLHILSEIRKVWAGIFFDRNKLKKQLIKDGFYDNKGNQTNLFYSGGLFAGKLMKRAIDLEIYGTIY